MILKEILLKHILETKHLCREKYVGIQKSFRNRN